MPGMRMYGGRFRSPHPVHPSNEMFEERGRSLPCHDGYHHDCPLINDFSSYQGLYHTVCECQCHDQKREEVISYIEFLRDAFALLDQEDPFDNEGIRQMLDMLKDQCGWQTREHAVDNLGEALTFLGYPNQPED